MGARAHTTRSAQHAWWPCGAAEPTGCASVPVLPALILQIDYNSWDAPPCFKFREWALDSQVGVPLAAEATALHCAAAGGSWAGPLKQLRCCVGSQARA